MDLDKSNFFEEKYHSKMIFRFLNSFSVNRTLVYDQKPDFSELVV